MPAFVVSIDGTDFSGKSTIASLIVEYLRPMLRGADIQIKRTALPSDLITGAFTKILRNSSDNVSQKVFSLAYALDHLHHYENFMKPLQDSGGKSVVIQERSVLTTLIYQGLIGTTNLNWLRTLNMYNGNTPNLTLIMRVPEEEIMKRKSIQNNTRGFDKFEAVEFLKKEIGVYYNLPKELEKEFHVRYVDVDNEEAYSIAQRCAHIIATEVEKFHGSLSAGTLRKFSTKK